MIEAGRSLPLLFQHDVGNEIGEMAAMAMELLVTPFLTGRTAGSTTRTTGGRPRSSWSAS
jgi:hypothetical protein